MRILKPTRRFAGVGLLAVTLGAIPGDRIGAQDARLGPAVIAELTNTLQTDLSQQNRIAAANRLGALGTSAQEAVPALLRALRDRDDYVRGASARALARIGPERPEVAKTIDALLRDKSPGVRQDAALALGIMGSHARASVAHLIVLLESDDYYGVREACAASLGQIAPGDSLMILPLVRALTGSSRTEGFDRSDANRRYYFHVQRSAAKALAFSGQPGIDALFDVLAARDDPSQWADEALSAISDRLSTDEQKILKGYRR